MLTRLAPMLATENIPATIKFYVEVLGFECQSQMPEAGWASVRRENVSIMFSLPNKHTPFTTPLLTGSLYITTDEVDVIWEQVKGRAEVCYPIDNFYYGMREFAIYDNNHYLLQFGQAIGSNTQE